LRFERHYDLDGCIVAVGGRGDDLSCVIDRLLGPYACSVATGTSAAIVIELDRRASRPTAPTSRPRFHFPPLGAWESASGGWQLVDDVAELDVQPGRERSTITGWLADDALMEHVSRFAGLTLWVALIECLRARGRYPLHGAALVAPDGKTVLFSGTKGAGKSTATLSLLERGYDVVTDDTLFLDHDAPDGAVGLYGYRKRFHVRPDLVARRPDLAAWARHPEPYEPQDKLWLLLEDRFPGRTRTHAAAPARIFFPVITPRATSRVLPLSSRDTLLRLLADSSFVFVRPELAPAHLACLRALVDGAAGALLECGRDLLADPGLYLELVGPSPSPSLISEGAPWPSSASASS
jgi:hypothetical protein